jgi:transcriptional regulator with XRE-family HTH domain
MAESKLKAARLEAGLSQESLARVAGVTLMTVYRAETKGNQRKNVSDATWLKLAKALGTTPDEIRNKGEQ